MGWLLYNASSTNSGCLLWKSSRPSEYRMIKNLLWDVDGTLFDTYPAIAGAFRAALNDLGTHADLARIQALAGESLGHCLTVLAAECHINEEALGRAFGERYDLVTFKEQPPFPGAKALCEYICSAGGKNVIVTHRSREGTAGLLAAHAMEDFFSGRITREDGYPRKPDPSSFAAALKSFGLKPEETMAVGDREIDILAGKAAGLLTCLYAGEGTPTAADLTTDDYSKLLIRITARLGSGFFPEA
jgi:phosphoglycolate phosphatase-like HAD superfamily hydrolase